MNEKIRRKADCIESTVNFFFTAPISEFVSREMGYAPAIGLLVKCISSYYGRCVCELVVCCFPKQAGALAVKIPTQLQPMLRIVLANSIGTFLGWGCTHAPWISKPYSLIDAFTIVPLVSLCSAPLVFLGLKIHECIRRKIEPGYAAQMAIFEDPDYEEKYKTEKTRLGHSPIGEQNPTYLAVHINNKKVVKMYPDQDTYGDESFYTDDEVSFIEEENPSA